MDFATRVSHEEGPASRSWPPLVLIASDEEWWFRSLESVLVPHGYMVLRAATAARVVEQVEAAAPDAVVLHAHLRGVPGVEICHALRRTQGVGQELPILITLPSPCSQEQRLEALRAGAWDCFSIPFNVEEMVLKLDLFTTAKLGADRVRARALLDWATGLYNTQGVLRRVQELGMNAARHRQALGCAVLSADAPQASERAPRAGQTQLQQVVEILTSVGRTSDILGRLSDTELVVLAPDTGPDGVGRMAERIIDAARARYPGDGIDAGDPLQLRIGCCAVANFAEALIEPVEIIVRAATALRSPSARVPSSPIRFFDVSHSAS